MTILIFVIILAVLIFSHELGHFLAAKSAGVRVDEFALGFPPKLVSRRWGETEYSLNLVPFGGFVKIFGETPDQESLTGPDVRRSLVHKSKLIQAWVMIAGVLFNLLLAWLLFTIGFATGLPIAASEASGLQTATPPKVLITSLAAESPAKTAGLAAGDEIVSLNGQAIGGVEQVQTFMAAHGGQKVKLGYHRGAVLSGQTLPLQTATVVPAGTPARIGITLDQVVLAKTGLLGAIGRGFNLTWELSWATLKAFWHLIVSAVHGESALGAVTGPIGLIGLVGDARSLGLIYLISFTALISINLAIINLMPFPALDGGRILFLIIEKIKGSAIKPALANRLNLIGFSLLIALMIFITIHDLWQLVG